MIHDENILNKDTIIVSETDASGKIVYVNNDFCNIAKFTKSELIGKSHSIVRHLDMPKSAFKNLWSVIKEGKTWKGVVKNKTKTGDYYWVHATIYPSRTPNGEIKYFSVRVKPTKDEILNAQKLYKTLD